MTDFDRDCLKRLKTPRVWRSPYISQELRAFRRLVAKGLAEENDQREFRITKEGIAELEKTP